MRNLLKFDIKTLIIIIEFIIILYLRSCGGNGGVVNTGDGTVKVDGKKYDVVNTIIDTIYIPITDTRIVYKRGKDIYHDTTIYVNVPVNVPVDTAEILKDFYAKNIYVDTLKFQDSLGFITIVDTISQNVIDGRTWISNLKNRTITKTVYLKEKPRNKVYYGFGLGLNKQQLFSSLETGFILNTKKDQIYKLDFGVNNGTFGYENYGLIPFVKVGTYIKIRVKK
jgi:hypothetical protein